MDKKRPLDDDESLSGSNMLSRSSALSDSDREVMVRHLVETPSFRLAFEDDEFLTMRELRGVRLQLEMLKPDMRLKDMNIGSTIVVFGGTRIHSEEESKIRIAKLEAKLKEAPDDSHLKRKLQVAKNILKHSHYYDEARKFARLVSGECQLDGKREYVIVTGGGPGVMEAANRGAYDIGAATIGFNILLPHEQEPNPYITPELCFQFHYFAVRKMHFLMRARALVVFPGGFGTLDELFECLTLVQTRKARVLPIILFGKEFWERVIDFDTLEDEGVIDPEDRELFVFAESAEEAWNHIKEVTRKAEGEIT
ncbi:MAG TPA: LOG family protein [candidate division Zixibacteria bacterium]|nr:LOG family protein [candidate division Zixibacteria bacterium]